MQVNFDNKPKKKHAQINPLQVQLREASRLLDGKFAGQNESD